MKKAVVIIVLLSFYTCREKDRILNIFIPEGYLGKVKLHFGIDSSKNHMLNSKDNMYVIFLSGKSLKNFTIKEKNFPGGPYIINYYFYSKDTLYQLNSTTADKKKVDTTFWVNGMGASGKNGSIQDFTIEKVR